ncbi:MAG: lycopene cyclase domain-containing protein [Bacteroidales bacterium]|nr:lycopene cyclase domain-containing protein [Bacteroidales bacterium]
MDKWLYLLLNIGSISIPFIASFDRRLRFDKYWRYLFPSMLLTMLVFIPWDMVKTSIGVWGFNQRYVLGFNIGNLPLEEWLFFIAIPFACLFTYHSLNYLVKKDILGPIARPSALILGAGLIITGIIFWSRTYTSVTFISTGLFLLIHYFVLRKDYLGRFFLMYLVTLLPFFLVDGVLTGSFIPGEVVYYDDSRNLGIRIGTIPIEDMVYGMLMLLMNVTWFEFLKSRKSITL